MRSVESVKMAAKALYGTVLGGSVTRLEQYASCAYAHFLNYGLELAERQQYELAAMDIGNLFHDSIDLCFKKMKEQGGDWKTIGEDERKALVHTCRDRGDRGIWEYDIEELCQKCLSGPQGGEDHGPYHMGAGGAAEERRFHAGRIRGVLLGRR